MSTATITPRKSNRRLIVVLAIVTAVAGGILAGAYFLGRTILDSGRAKDAASAFLTDLENGRIEDAHARLCADTRQNRPLDQFRAQVSQRKPTVHEHTGELRVNGTPGGTTGTVGMRISYADGSTENTLMSLRREDDTWRVCDW